MSTRKWLAGIAALALGDAFVFAPEPGTELERRWSEELEMDVDSLEQTLGGMPIELPFDLIQFDAERSFELADELIEVAGGRATTLVRAFASSELDFALELGGEPAGTLVGRHACDGAEVRFRWDAEQETHARERLEGELDEEALERLEPDLDLAALLPEGELEPGATFEPPLEALRVFFRAGGDLGWRPVHIELARGDVPPELMIAGALGTPSELFAPGSELTGRLRGRHAGREGDEGAERVRLEYELDIEVAAELGARFRAFMREATPESHDLTLAAELEGELVLTWDVAARRPRPARFEGEVAMEGHLVFPMERGGTLQPFVGAYELSGTAIVELSSE